MTQVRKSTENETSLKEMIFCFLNFLVAGFFGRRPVWLAPDTINKSIFLKELKDILVEKLDNYLHDKSMIRKRNIYSNNCVHRENDDVWCTK
jgi:hypothetical protein